MLRLADAGSLAPEDVVREIASAFGKQPADLVAMLDVNLFDIATNDDDGEEEEEEEDDAFSCSGGNPTQRPARRH